MALTDDCALFGSIHEDGVNLVARHVMRQRPSLFNYGTAQIAANNPIMTVVPPLPLANTVYGINYSFQITKAEIDLHPGNVVTLPSQLSPPLDAQRFAAHVQVCGGIGCPSKEIVDDLRPSGPRPRNHDRPEEPVTPLSTRKLECFCLEVFVVGHVEIEEDELAAKLDGLEIVDITPDGLESSLECYLELLLKLAIFPQLRVALSTLGADPLDPA